MSRSLNANEYRAGRGIPVNPLALSPTFFFFLGTNKRYSNLVWGVKLLEDEL